MEPFGGLELPPIARGDSSPLLEVLQDIIISVEGRLFQWDTMLDGHMFLRRRRANELAGIDFRVSEDIVTRHPQCVREARALLETDTIPQFVWPAALPLGVWICKHTAMLAGTKILELGSGVGIGGMSVLATANPKLVVLTDCSTVSLAIMSCSLRRWVVGGDVCPRQLKNSPSRCAIAKLRWGNASDLDAIKRELLGGASQTFDVVLGSDVFYFQKSLEDGLQTAHSALCRGGVFICGSFVRSDRMDVDLERIPSLHGFDLQGVCIPASEEGWTGIHGQEPSEDDMAFRLYTWAKL